MHMEESVMWLNLGRKMRVPGHDERMTQEEFMMKIVCEIYVGYRVKKYMKGV